MKENISFKYYRNICREVFFGFLVPTTFVAVLYFTFMAENKKSFILYADQIHLFESLSDNEAR